MFQFYSFRNFFQNVHVFRLRFKHKLKRNEKCTLYFKVAHCVVEAVAKRVKMCLSLKFFFVFWIQRLSLCSMEFLWGSFTFGTQYLRGRFHTAKSCMFFNAVVVVLWCTLPSPSPPLGWGDTLPYPGELPTVTHIPTSCNSTQNDSQMTSKWRHLA